MTDASAGVRRSELQLTGARLTAVIFDFDGVIADTEDLHFASFRTTLREAGIEITRAENDRHYLGLNDQLGFERAFERAGRTLARAACPRLQARKAEIYHASLGEVELCPGALELIEEAGRRWPLGIASSGKREEIGRILDRFDLRHAFAALVTAEDGIPSKPAPDIYRNAVAELSSSGSPDCGSALAIEDTPTGVRAAKAAGLRCVAVLHTCPAETLAEADRIVTTLVQVASEWR